MLTPEHNAWSCARDRKLSEFLRDIPGCKAVEKRLQEHDVKRTCLGGVPGCQIHVAGVDGGAFSPWLPETEAQVPQAPATKGRVKRTAAAAPISNNGYARRKDIDVAVDVSLPTSAHMERYRNVYTYRDRNPEVIDTSFNESIPAQAAENEHRLDNWDSLALTGQTHMYPSCPRNQHPPQLYPHQAIQQPQQQHPPTSHRHQYLTLLSGDQVNRQTTPPRATQTTPTRPHPRVNTPTASKPPQFPQAHELSAAYMYQKQCQRLQYDPSAKLLPTVTGNEKLNRLPSGNRRRHSDHRGQSGPGFVLKGRLQVVDFNHGLKNKPEMLVSCMYM